MTVSLQVYPDARTLARATAWQLASLLNQSGRRSLGLAGGSTPGSTYAFLSKMDVNWNEVDLWLGDERWVANDDLRSNGLMAHEALSKRTGANLSLVEYGPDSEPTKAAEEYGERLSAIFRQTDGRPDTVLLGIGDDGHTASLFPGSTAVHERERRYVAEFQKHLDMWRLTASIPMLAAANQIVFLVAGSSKAEALRWLVAPRGDDPLVPSRRLLTEASNVLVMVDIEAASQIESPDM